MKKKPIWRVKPAMSSAGKPTWILESQQDESCLWTHQGYFKTVRDAKAMVAHLRSQPIFV